MEDWVRLYRKRALGLVYLTAFAGGLAEHAEATPARLIAAFSVASAIVLYCDLDARLHNKVFLHSFGWVMFLSWPVGTLAYLVWTRGRRGLLTYLGMAFGFLVAIGLGFGAGSLLG